MRREECYPHSGQIGRNRRPPGNDLHVRPIERSRSIPWQRPAGIGCQEGDRVAIYVGNIPEFIVAFFANCKIGAISVPFNTMLKGMEIEYILNNSGSKILFGMAGETEQNILPILDKIPALEKIISVRGMAGGGSNPDILAFEKLSQTISPNTQRLIWPRRMACPCSIPRAPQESPRAALSTHASWTYQAAMNAGFAVQITDEDLVLTGAPFFHVYVVMTVLPTLYAGGAVVALQRFFAKDTLALITKHKITHFMGAPDNVGLLIEELMKNKDLYDISSFRLGQCAGASLAAELGRQIQETFGVGLVECYGSRPNPPEGAKVTPRASVAIRPAARAGPFPGWEIKIVGEW